MPEQLASGSVQVCALFGGRGSVRIESEARGNQEEACAERLAAHR